MTPKRTFALAATILAVLGVACNDGGSGSRSPTNLQPINPNLLKFMALTTQDLQGQFEETDSGFLLRDQTPVSGAPSGWIVAYQSSFEANERRTSPVDEVVSSLELYTDGSLLERNVKLSVFADSEKFSEFETEVGEDSVGYGHADGIEGLSDRLYVIRFRLGPIIASAYVTGDRDLTPEAAQEAVSEYARILSDRIESTLESPPLSPPPP